jgi:hypothetical protein
MRFVGQLAFEFFISLNIMGQIVTYTILT